MEPFGCLEVLALEWLECLECPGCLWKVLKVELILVVELMMGWDPL